MTKRYKHFGKKNYYHWIILFYTWIFQKNQPGLKRWLSGSRGRGWIPQHPHGSCQSSITPVPGECSFWPSPVPVVHMVCRPRRQNSHTHKTKLHFFLEDILQSSPFIFLFKIHNSYFLISFDKSFFFFKYCILFFVSFIHLYTTVVHSSSDRNGLRPEYAQSSAVKNNQKMLETQINRRIQ